MTSELQAFIQEQADILIDASSACPEAVAAANSVKAALGTEKEKDAVAAFIAEMKADISPIEGTIEFAKSHEAKEIMGVEGARNLLNALIEEQENGGKYCTCDACRAAAAVIEREAELLA